MTAPKPGSTIAAAEGEGLRQPDDRSIAERVADLGAERRTALLQALPPQDCALLEHDWRFWARPSQLAPLGDWQCWLVLAGRGFGKTRMGAEWVRDKARDCDARIALAGASFAETRAIMVEGPSGILNISADHERPVFEPSKHMLRWPNGAIGYLYSGDQPDSLRGPQHSAAWIDELAKFFDPASFWDMLSMGLRLGSPPQAMVTTTPRPLPFLKDLLAQEATVTTSGSTWANARNLAPSFIAHMHKHYGGTRLGAQELDGAILEDVAGALWTHALIEHYRAPMVPTDFVRIVVAIDPPVTAHAASDACGIIVAARDDAGHGYVLADESVEQASPAQWSAAALDALQTYGADRLVAEVNQGGDLVETLLRTQVPNVPYRAVRAVRGKWLRAEPIAALYEQGRIHHCGRFTRLEDEMTNYVPGQSHSPDRLDALVWAFTDLLLGADQVPSIRQLKNDP